MRTATTFHLCITTTALALAGTLAFAQAKPAARSSAHAVENRSAGAPLKGTNPLYEDTGKSGSNPMYESKQNGQAAPVRKHPAGVKYEDRTKTQGDPNQANHATEDTIKVRPPRDASSGMASGKTAGGPHPPYTGTGPKHKITGDEQEKVDGSPHPPYIRTGGPKHEVTDNERSAQEPYKDGEDATVRTRAGNKNILNTHSAATSNEKSISEKGLPASHPNSKPKN